jgi:hypothetical protein
MRPGAPVLHDDHSTHAAHSLNEVAREPVRMIVERALLMVLGHMNLISVRIVRRNIDEDVVLKG